MIFSSTIDFFQTLCMTRTWCYKMKNQIKMRPYRGQLFFLRYQRFHIINIFYDFHRLICRHDNIGCIIRILWIIIFFQFKTFYYTHKLLNIAIQLMKHIYKLSITLFTTNKISTNLFILRDVFLRLNFYIIEVYQILPIYYPMYNKHKKI